MRYFLRMEVAEKLLVCRNEKHIHDLLIEIGMLGCKACDKPIDTGKRIENSGNPVETDRYQRLVEKLIYLSHTRLDIAFAVSMVSQHMHSPKEIHMEAVYRILRYLKGSSRKGLFFNKSENRIVEVFTDADWASSTDDRRSTTGYYTFAWENLVTDNRILIFLLIRFNMIEPNMLK
ncbi:uncharacterized protein LOC111405130 [Olea europaea var. sylvestris]|uniref:uncharacterized protein LOC111405130 n=1 Tax=Olea europaea var. sylvestris TaxID=158386 RepID=UPI000C1D4A77|nr:uncharacterized protein LOC111405130 [Olea europaea var. sylvestris]